MVSWLVARLVAVGCLLGFHTTPGPSLQSFYPSLITPPFFPHQEKITGQLDLGGGSSARSINKKKFQRSSSEDRTDSNPRNIPRPLVQSFPLYHQTKQNKKPTKGGKKKSRIPDKMLEIKRFHGRRECKKLTKVINGCQATQTYPRRPQHGHQPAIRCEIVDKSRHKVVTNDVKR